MEKGFGKDDQGKTIEEIDFELNKLEENASDKVRQGSKTGE